MNCSECRYFNGSNVSDSFGRCEFWEQEVHNNDYCVEFKAEDLKDEDRE